MSTVGPEHDPNAGRVEVEGIVATDQPLSAYGGIRVDETVLHDLAEALRSGSLPMLLSHDIRRPLNAVVLDSEVRERPDGYKEVWIRFTVQADAWAQYQEELAAFSVPGGFSFAVSETIADLPALSVESAASIALEADASYWSDEVLLSAAEDLRVAGSVHVGRRYQFALEPLAIVVLSFVLAPILTGLATNALYDGLKRFLHSGRRTIFQFHVERQDGDVVEARLETDDSEVLRDAIGAFDRLVNPGQLNEWNVDERTWSEAKVPPSVKLPADASVSGGQLPEWIRRRGIINRASGQERARSSWNTLISAGRRVLGSGLSYRVEHLVFSGFLARAQGLHEGVVAGISSDNPYAAFTLLRAYAENAAAILYAKDHPAELERFWRDIDGPGVELEAITNYANQRFEGFDSIYSQLRRWAEPQATSLLAGNQVSDNAEIQWSSVPKFKSDHDAVMACVWVVELAEANSHLLMEFAAEFGLLNTDESKSS